MHVFKEIKRNFRDYGQKDLVRTILKLLFHVSHRNLVIVLGLAYSDNLMTSCMIVAKGRKKQ